MGILRNLSPLILATGVAAFSDPFDQIFELTINFADGRNTSFLEDVPSAGVDRTVSAITLNGLCNSEGSIKTEDMVNRLDIITSASDACDMQVFLGYNFETPENFTAGDNNALLLNFSPFYNLAEPPMFVTNDFSWVACTVDCDTAYPSGFPFNNVASHTLPMGCGRHTRNVAFGSSTDAMGYWAMEPLELADFGSIGCFFGEVESEIGTTFGLSLLESTAVTTPGSLLGDPHLVGFHGERTELMASKPTYYSIFCDSTTMVNIRTEPTSEGAVYMMAVKLNILNEFVELDISSFDDLEGFSANSPSFMTVENGVAIIQSPVLKMEISKSVESGVEFLDVSFSASEAAPAGGIIGRTLSRALSAEEFAAVEQFEVNEHSHTGAHFCTM